MGWVLQILTASSPASPMTSHTAVLALPGIGLERDRYALGHGTFSPPTMQPKHELTLIEAEALEAFAAESGVAFKAADARRNLVTRGIRLNPLVGTEFSIGPVRVRGISLCEPCHYLAKQTHPAVLRGLVHRGGLRAQILTEGIIKANDLIVPEF